MRTSATGAVYTSSAVDSPIVIRCSVITVVVVLSSHHRTIGPSATGSIDAICTDHGMGLIADGETAD
jgi:hypothetical protein